MEKQYRLPSADTKNCRGVQPSSLVPAEAAASVNGVISKRWSGGARDRTAPLRDFPLMSKEYAKE